LQIRNKREYKFIHKLVADAFLGNKPNGINTIVDHINNNKLDNRACNLQFITQRENCSKNKSGGSSKYTGVYWYKPRSKWTAKIYINGHRKYLGLFSKELDASAAYQKALSQLSSPPIKV